VYLTSDWHLFHKNIIKYCKRPFQTLEEMGEKLIENYMMIVEPSDKVIFLGDLTIKRDRRYIEVLTYIFKNLPGKKILVRGNHDYFKEKDYLEMGFIKVLEKMETDNFLLVHDPVGWKTNKFIIHGHTHNGFHRGDFSNKKYINVCVDVTDFKPVSFDEIKRRLK
jgi:calcineurin-like phosphoesterase family protein